MITKEQENQVAAYLISKKLSPQILIEVKDHFILQITDLMDNENKNFHEAFLATKFSWKKELDMVRADLFSFRKVTRIEKDVLSHRFRKIMVISTMFSALSFLLLLLNNNLFVTLQILFLGGWFLLLIYNLIKKQMKLSNYIAMSFHPLLVRNFLLGIAVFLIGHALMVDYCEIIDRHMNKVLLMYSLVVQVQLLYFNSRKVNVLI